MRRDVSQKKVAKARFIVLLLSIGVKWSYNLYKIIDFPNAIHSKSWVYLRVWKKMQSHKFYPMSNTFS